MLCAVHRRRISHALDSDTGLPVAVEAHMRSCADCREYYEAMRGVETRLADEAWQGLPEALDGLHSGIMSEVRSVTEQDAAEHAAVARRSSLPLAWLPVAVAAVVVVVLGFALWIREPGTGSGGPVKVNGSGEQIAARVGFYEEGVRNAVSGAGKAIDGPLEREMADLGRDLAATADFLLGCLPGDGSVRNDG